MLTFLKFAPEYGSAEKRKVELPAEMETKLDTRDNAVHDLPQNVYRPSLCMSAASVNGHNL